MSPSSPNRLSTPRFLAFLALFTLALGGCGDDPTGPGADVDGADAAQDVSTDAVGDSGEDDAGTDVATDTADASPDAVADTGDAGADISTDTRPDTFFDPDIGADAATDTTDSSGPIGVYSIDPALGPEEGGTFVAIFGYGFTVNTVVLVNGRPLERVDFVDSETLLAYTPANPAGVYDVKFASGDEEFVLAGGFEYFADLSLDAIEPATGPTRGGVPARVTGSGFTDDTRVSVGGRLGIDARVIGSTAVEFVVPPGVAGDAEVRVTNTFGSAALADAFNYYAEPLLSGAVPAAGATTGGYDVVLMGTGLDTVTTVRFGAATATIVDQSEAQLTVTVPPGAAGPADIAVVGTTGGSTILAGFRYVNTEGALAVDAVVPASGALSGGYDVTVAGPGVDAATDVQFAGVSGAITASSPGALLVTVPAGASVGAVDVEVTTADASATGTGVFAYIDDLAIDSVTPPTGDVAGGETITVAGSGFTAATRVAFGPVFATTTLMDAGTLSVVAPPGPLGVVDVQVVDGDRVATLADGYTYTEAPVATGLVPSRGAIAGNTYVVVRGRGFQGDVRVTFNGIDATDVTIIDGATLAVRTPRFDEAGRAAVRVYVNEEEAEGRLPFAYYDPWSPAGGWWGGPVEGSVNATVEDARTGERIVDAFVTLNLRADGPSASCVTNDRGQCVISAPGINGPQTVSASAVDYSAATVTDVDARNVILQLNSLVMPPPSGGGGDTPPSISGTLEGLDKIVDPADDERIVGVIRTSTPGVGAANPDGTGFAQVTWDGGSEPIPYAMASREGELAVVALCGVLNETTGDFTPLYMGIRRGLAVRGVGTEYEVNLECDIHLSQTMTFKFRNPPIYPGGPQVNQAIPYLDLGNEGATDLLRIAEGRGEIITQDHFAPLSHPALADASYEVIGQTVPNDGGFPYSVVYARDIIDPDDRIDFPESVPPPNILYPADSGTVVERRFEWSLATDVNPDFYYAYIQDASQSATFWEVWLPGDQSGFNLPYFPPGTPEAMPSGTLVFIILAIDAYTFDYEEFEGNDFGSWNWKSYGVAGQFFINPG